LLCFEMLPPCEVDVSTTIGAVPGVLTATVPDWMVGEGAGVLFVSPPPHAASSKSRAAISMALLVTCLKCIEIFPPVIQVHSLPTICVLASLRQDARNCLESHLANDLRSS